MTTSQFDLSKHNTNTYCQSPYVPVKNAALQICRERQSLATLGTSASGFKVQSSSWLSTIVTVCKYLFAYRKRICILYAIKYWRWERPGNEAITEEY